MRVLAQVVAAVGTAASALAVDCKDGYHCTNSHLHDEVRAYPIERAGHNRGAAKPLPRYDPDLNSTMSSVMTIKVQQREECEAREECPRFYQRAATIPCQNGKVNTADETFDCEKIDLLGFVPIKDMNSDREASDIWGWTDPETEDKIAIIGMEDRTGFVKVTRNADGTVTPKVLATLLQSGDRNVIWSDMKVYGNYVFIVRESNHGMQVFDLTKLRQWYESDHPVQLGQDDLSDFYGVTAEAGFPGKNRNVHNIVINEQTGFAYLVGSQTCRGGLHAVDISSFGTDATNASPKAEFKGCFSADGYTHDAQCVLYNGPDAEFAGKEICWAYNEDTVTVVDVSDKDNMVQISRRTYVDASYTHQGWLTEDQRYVIANDELDEMNTKEKRTRTLVWDYASLREPVLMGFRFSADGLFAVDHNLYVNGDRIYLSNYCSGLRVYEISDLFNENTLGDDALTAAIPQVAFFDTAPYCDTSKAPVFQGAWSSFPYFKDDTPNQMVIVSNIETGLFVFDVKN